MSTRDDGDDDEVGSTRSDDDGDDEAGLGNEDGEGFSVFWSEEEKRR